MNYISIDENNRSSGRNYNLEGFACITTQELENIDEENCSILLHANDVRYNKTLRDRIIRRMQGKKRKVFLFTNDSSRGKDIEDFSPSIVYTWLEICNSHPVLPPPDKKQHFYLIALSVLCQGYLAAHGGVGLDDGRTYQRI